MSDKLKEKLEALTCCGFWSKGLHPLVPLEGRATENQYSDYN